MILLIRSILFVLLTNWAATPVNPPKVQDKPLRVFMAGKVAKGEEIGSIKDWRVACTEKLKQVRKFEFISPENPKLDESKPFTVFGYACKLIRDSDFVLVDASRRLGAGTAQEMIIAKYFDKHVLTILPRNTYHRRTNLQMYDVLVEDWIHPFVFALSDHIFGSIEEVVDFLIKHPNFLAIAPKKLSIIDEAIASYEAIPAVE